MDDNLYIHQKTETSNWVKITNEVYKLLDFFPESEPLKNKAKEKALAILENLTLIYGKDGWTSIKACLPVGRERACAELINDIEVLENYLILGKYQGWIDSINFLIIKKEYDKIKIEISPSKRLVRSVLQNSGDLLPHFKKKSEIDPVIESVKPTTIKDDAHEKKAPSLTEGSLGGSSVSAGPERLEGQNMTPSDFSLRQEKILKILSGREKTQVSDIIKEIPDITKRTIRRDLDDLLKKSKIIRAGEWNQVFYKISPIK